jgi:hypothetical protein
MKTINSYFNSYSALVAMLVWLVAGCEIRDITELQRPSFPATPDVFRDDFTGDLAYAAFGGSDVKAFQVDTRETYGGTLQSMRFAVPDANSPEGAYAGGVFFSKVGRNLSGYNALTFYIKATQPATIGVVGFGNDLGENKYEVSQTDLPVNTNWRKVIIPIPDAAKLTAEKGLFYYSAGPIDGRGFTFWVDEVRFERLPDLANPVGVILDGQERVINNAETGDTYTLNGLKARVNLPTGVNTLVNVAPSYFTFSSSASSSATVSERGIVSVGTTGTSTITATLGGRPAEGSFRVSSVGAALLPPTAAAAPTREAANVISLYSNAYQNVPVDTWNTRWQFSTAEESFVRVGGDDMIRYRNLNFVGIEFKSPPVNASSMQFLHLDLWTPDPTNVPNNFNILLVDFGSNGVFGGGDDSQHEVRVTAPKLTSGNWVSLDIPMSDFAGLRSRAHLAQMVLSGTLPNVFIDNVYFYRNPSTPPGPAPVPSKAAANVLSLFSDSYPNVPGTDFFPNWGQTTVVSQVPLGGNNTLWYRNFNYQGVQLANSQDVSSYASLHLDYFSSNATNLQIFLISPGPVEKPYTLTVPTAGWNSVDIPLSAFAPVDLKNIIQLKFDGGGSSDIYMDNMYFWKATLSPTTAAPTPTYPAAGVISIFSDAYPNVAGSDLNPNWGQATAVTQTAIGGNNTLVYTGLNYQGLQFGSNQNVATKQFLHLDYFSGNSTELKISLICPPNSPGGQAPWEKSFTLTVPTTGGWNRVDIPLSHFLPTVALNNVFQLKFEGNGTIYLDNILFR